MFKWFMRIAVAVPLVFSGYAILPRAVDAVRIFGFRNDPVQMLLYRLSDLDKAAYEREINAALVKDDPELARSLADLAADRHVALDGGLLQKISEAEQFSLTRSAGQLLDGAVTGNADSPTAFAGALASDLTVIGDVRDLMQQGMLYPDQDNLTVALAATGVAMTGALALTGGTSAAGKVGLSALKAAKRMGRLSKSLERELVRLTADAIDSRAMRSIGRNLGGWNFAAAADELKRLVKPGVVKELGKTGDALRGVFTRQGYRGTLQVLGSAENTTDIRRLERMSQRLGGKFRGALLLKRGTRLTFRFTEFLVHVVVWLASACLWLLWAGYTLLRSVWRLGKVPLRLIRLVRRRLWPPPVPGAQFRVDPQAG